MAKTLTEIAQVLWKDNEEEQKKFVKLAEESGLKLADLSSGDFVTKEKYNDHVKKYDTLKTDYKTLQDKNNDEVINNLTKERDDLKVTVSNLNKDIENGKNKSLLKNYKVDDKFANFVLSEVSQKVTDTVNFEDCLKAYVKENEHFLTTEQKDKGSGFSFQNGGNKNTNIDYSNNGDIDKALNSIIRGEK